ncbi:MAG: hypothetical protein LBO69_00320 [Ignavibacteria bacterium]|jgi:hypothetical protein|nr:hypothetical protein [Ignavibacteria bacterium]
MISEELLSEVINTKKTAFKAKYRKLMLGNRHYSNKISLRSDDGKFQYSLVLRKSESFIEDFSVLLIWENANEYSDVNKNIILARYQGPHDGKEPEGVDIHHSYHTHKITSKDIEVKRYLKPSNRKETEAYNSFEQAIQCFITDFGIVGVENTVEPFVDNKQLPERIIIEDISNA